MPHQPQHFYQRVIRCIAEHQMIQAGDRVIVGVSGGIDSIVLLSVFHHLREVLGITLHSAHLNHQLRGAEAERDAEFVRQFSAQLGIPCSIESANVTELSEQHGLSLQDAARQVRYRFFDTLAHQLNAQKIATAHNADDQAETVLLGLIRGVGRHGLGGIQPVLKGQIIRPLLTTTRAQITAFAQAMHLDYVEDSSNASRKYLRNAVRLDLLPLLQRQFNPAIVSRLTAYAQTCREDADFIETVLRNQYPQICKNVAGRIKINLDLFKQEHITIQRAIVYHAFEALTGSRQRLETKHVRAVLALFQQTVPDKRLSLPGGVFALRTREGGELCTTSPTSPPLEVHGISIPVPGTCVFDAWEITTRLDPAVSSPMAFTSQPDDSDGILQQMDYDSIVGELTVRYRLPGDVFQPFGLDGKQTLKKFFIDRKLPKEKRRSIPIVVDTLGIVWVVGYRIAQRVRLTPATRRVVVCTVHQRQTPVTNTPCCDVGCQGA